MYYDRLDAGRKLIKYLKKYQSDPGVVLAVPRGGVPIGYVVAKELGFPLNLLLTKKIGHPHNKEYAIGAVCLTGSYIVPHDDVPEAYLEIETERIRKKLLEMHKKFMGDMEPEPLKGKTVIVVDDGIATGNTLIAVINVLLQEKPAKIIIAVPVAPQSAIQKLSRLVDEIVCPLIPRNFWGVGAFYENFDQVSDEEVLHYLNKLRKELGQPELPMN